MAKIAGSIRIQSSTLTRPELPLLSICHLFLIPAFNAYLGRVDQFTPVVADSVDKYNYKPFNPLTAVYTSFDTQAQRHEVTMCR